MSNKLSKEKTNDDLFDDYDVFSILSMGIKLLKKVVSEHRRTCSQDEYMDDISDDDEDERIDLTSR